MLCPLRPPGCGQPLGLPQGTHISTGGGPALVFWPQWGYFPSPPRERGLPIDEGALQCGTCHLHPSGSTGGGSGGPWLRLGRCNQAAEGKRCGGKGPGLSVPLTWCLWPTCSVTWRSSLPVPKPQSLLRFLRGSENQRRSHPLYLSRVCCPYSAAHGCGGRGELGAPQVKPGLSVP